MDQPAQGPSFQFQVFDPSKSREPNAVILNQALVRGEEAAISANRFDLLSMLSLSRQLVQQASGDDQTVQTLFSELYTQLNGEEATANDVHKACLYAARAVLRLRQGRKERVNHWAAESLRHSALASMGTTCQNVN